MNKLVVGCYVGLSTRLLEISGYFELLSFVLLATYIVLGGAR
jgi:hypothetical protein